MHTEIAQAVVMAIINPGRINVDLLSGLSFVIDKWMVGFIYNMGKNEKPDIYSLLGVTKDRV
jgi:hypothetical protein